MPTSATSPQNLGAKCDDIHDDLKVIGHGSQVKGISPSSGFFTSSDEAVQTSGVFVKSILSNHVKSMSSTQDIPGCPPGCVVFFVFF